MLWVFLLAHQPAVPPSFSLPSGLSIPWDIAILRPINNPTMASKCSSERKSQRMRQNSLLSNFKELPRLPQHSATTPHPSSQQSSTLRQDPPPAKRWQLCSRLNWWFSLFFFRVKCFFNYGKYNVGEHNAIAHFIDYSVVETELLCALGKPKISVWLALLRHLLYCSGLEPKAWCLQVLPVNQFCPVSFNHVSYPSDS